ncbi:MAG TPA: SDR family NAD(P)-dependent oxidoreductase [Solirubrobacteraceae bacterium]
MEIDGSAVLVAGGASGLGEATARHLHGAGASVTIADLNAERGEALAAELGGRASFAHTDVTQAETVQAAVAQAAASADGGLRISVCCAGIGHGERVAGRRGAHALEPFEKVIAVNLIGTFNVLRLAAASMLGNEPLDSGERGVCVNTASIAAFDGQIGQVAYSASKGGIVGMTLPAARDLAVGGVRVCTIAPGTFETPLLGELSEETQRALGDAVPFPSRLGQPSEYAALAAHIISNQMLNGEVIRLDGALRMPPR